MLTFRLISIGKAWTILFLQLWFKYNHCFFSTGMTLALNNPHRLIYNKIKSNQNKNVPTTMQLPTIFGYKHMNTKRCRKFLSSTKKGMTLGHKKCIYSSHSSANLARHFSSLINKKRCQWCNGYRRRNWTRRHEFKSWTDCISHSTNTLGKGMNPIILPPAMGK